MRHFRSWDAEVAACGAKCGHANCFSRHMVVTCEKCIVLLVSLPVECCHPDCGWRGKLHETASTLAKKRICPTCAKQSTYARPNINYVRDEFGTMVVYPPFKLPEDAEE